MGCSSPLEFLKVIISLTTALTTKPETSTHEYFKFKSFCECKKNHVGINLIPILRHSFLEIMWPDIVSTGVSSEVSWFSQ